MLIISRHWFSTSGRRRHNAALEGLQKLVHQSAKMEISPRFRDRASLRENATTHNYTPQNLPHTNSPIAQYPQYLNGNLNHTKKCL